MKYKIGDVMRRKNTGELYRIVGAFLYGSEIWYVFNDGWQNQERFVFMMYDKVNSIQLPAEKN